MKTPDAVGPKTAVSRLKERWLGASHEPGAALPALVPERRLRFPARIAEFLLVFRMRARRPSPTSNLLERAVQVVLVTCKHWFGNDADTSQRDSRRRL